MSTTEDAATAGGLHDHLRDGHYAAACPCRDLLDLIANRWSALIIGALEDGPLRFGELKRTLGGVSPKVLSSTLKRLEDSDLLLRDAFPEIPVRVEYSLTDLGRSVSVPLTHLRTWAHENTKR